MFLHEDGVDGLASFPGPRHFQLHEEREGTGSDEMLGGAWERGC